MDGITLTPDLERFAAEALASGRYRDLSRIVAAGVSLLQRSEAARTTLLASVMSAQEEGDRTGYLAADEVVARVEARLAGPARLDGVNGLRHFAPQAVRDVEDAADWLATALAARRWPDGS